MPYKHLDIGAIAIYFTFGAVVVFLVYLLFDVKRIASGSRRLEYLSGDPDNADHESAEGVIEVDGDVVHFREEDSGKVHFSLPLRGIKEVRKEYGGSGHSNNVARNIHRFLDERQYLFIELKQEPKSRTLRFSSHRTSHISDEVAEKILTAKKSLIESSVPSGQNRRV